MIFSLALILLIGLLSGAVFRSLKLPGIIGMLAAGIVIGPYVLDLIDDSVLNISSELRRIALIIILIRAGLTLNVNDLKKVGRPAVMMSFVPACFEIAGYVLLAPVLLGVNTAEAAVMGAVLSAVSPAVVVPRMVNLIEERYGTEKGIPQMILAGASCDDIFVIVVFGTFLNMLRGGNMSAAGFSDIPLSVVSGVTAGAAAGLAVWYLTEMAYKNERMIRNSIKVIIILGVSFGLMSAEELMKDTFPFSGLLAVTSAACVYRIKADSNVSRRLSEKFGKLWLAAEIFLFVLVGAAVDIRYTVSAGASAVIMIFAALVFRAVGVWICTLGTKLTVRERIFCVTAYLPKATVQAAIGSVPLSLGLPCGKQVLSVAVAAIILTAPLGAIGIDLTYRKCLERESD